MNRGPGVVTRVTGSSFDGTDQPRPERIYASGVLADGKLYYVSRENGTHVVSAAPQFPLLAHKMIDSNGSVFNGSPAVDRQCLLLRSNRFLYCNGRSPR